MIDPNLTILQLDTIPCDIELLNAELSKSVIIFQKFNTACKDEFVNSPDNIPDIIISDWRAPSSTELEALEILKAGKLIIPFFLIVWKFYLKMNTATSFIYLI